MSEQEFPQVIAKAMEGMVAGLEASVARIDAAMARLADVIAASIKGSP